MKRSINIEEVLFDTLLVWNKDTGHIITTDTKDYGDRLRDCQVTPPKIYFFISPILMEKLNLYYGLNIYKNYSVNIEEKKYDRSYFPTQARFDQYFTDLPFLYKFTVI